MSAELKQVTVTPQKTLTIYGPVSTTREMPITVNNPLNKTLTFRIKKLQTKKLVITPRFGYIKPKTVGTIKVKARALDSDETEPQDAKIAMRLGVVDQQAPPKAKHFWKRQFGPAVTINAILKVVFCESSKRPAEKAEELSDTSTEETDDESSEKSEKTISQKGPPSKKSVSVVIVKKAK